MINIETTKETKKVKLTVAKDRVSVKFPSHFTESEKLPYIKAVDKIIESVGTPEKTMRGAFRNGSILLSTDKNTFHLKFDDKGEKI